MISTSVGIFWVDILFKPAARLLFDCPVLMFLLVMIVYGCIAYRCLRSVAEG